MKRKEDAAEPAEGDASLIVLPEDALPDADGLLGMNVLGQFDFAIMPQSSELILTERD